MSDTITETATIAMLEARLEALEGAVAQVPGALNSLSEASMSALRCQMDIDNRARKLEADSGHSLECTKTLAAKIKELAAK